MVLVAIDVGRREGCIRDVFVVDLLVALMLGEDLLFKGVLCPCECVHALL